MDSFFYHFIKSSDFGVQGADAKGIFHRSQGADAKGIFYLREIVEADALVSAMQSKPEKKKTMELCRGLIYEVCSQKEFNLVVMKVTNVAPSSILQVMGDSNIILE